MSLTSPVRHLQGPLQKEISPLQCVTIEVPPGDYGLHVSEWKSSAQRPPAPQRRILEEIHRPAKLTWPLHGYLSITNNERWDFSSALSKKGETNGFAFEFWDWHLEVPSRPGFRLSQSPELPGYPTPQMSPPIPPPTRYHR
jgi:hypothetical protein